VVPGLETALLNSLVVFTVFAHLQHAAVVESTQASKRVRAARHFGQRQAIKKKTDIHSTASLFPEQSYSIRGQS